MGFLQELQIRFIIAFLNVFVIAWPLLILVFNDFFLRQQTFHSLPLSEAKQTWKTEASDAPNLHIDYLNLPAD